MLSPLNTTGAVAPPRADARRRTGNIWIPLGLGVSAVSAAASSFDGLRSLAFAVGWSTWMAPALPATVDALAITSTGLWVTGTAAAPKVRRFARMSALLAIAMSVGGNAAWHLHAAGLLPLNFAIVLGVGTVPPIVLGLCSHLAALRRLAVLTEGAVESPAAAVPAVTEASPHQSPEDGPRDRPGPRAVSASSRRRSRPPAARGLSEDELLELARQADLRHRQEHGGKPITRDELRRVLRVGGTKATVLLRQLRADLDGSTSSG